ncbi:recombinase family protein [Ralstonia mannitolilytica]|nr:recombinase family protein [Ralstonia mannitolilytica]
MAETFSRPPDEPLLLRGAEYVRMSTEHQQYSTQNQADKIREYAQRRGIQIVRTYADEGSLVRAYQAVGFTPDRDYHYIEINRFLRRLHPQIIGHTERMIAELGGSVERDSATDLLTVNREFSVSIVLSRCQVLETGSHRWKVRFDASLLPDITVAVRLDAANEGPLDYYLLPRLDFGLPRISLADHNRFELETYRFGNLDYLYGMAERSRIRRAA